MNLNSAVRNLFNHPWLAPILLAVGIVCLHSWSLMRYPAPFVDEAWFASRAWAFINTGQPFGDLDRGVFEWFEGAWTVFPYFPTWVQSLALRFSSTPELLPLRIVSLLFGLGLLAAVYRIGRRLGDRRLGMAAAALTAVSSSFLYSAHLARYDIMVAALGFGALAVYLERPAGSFFSGVMSGALLGLAFETHPNGAVYGLPIIVSMWLNHRRKFLQNPAFWGFAVGTLLALAIYAAVHILPYPQTYTDMSRLVYSATHTPPILTGDVLVVARSFGETFSGLVNTYLFLLPMVLVAPLALLLRRKPGDLRVLALLFTLLIMDVVLVRNKWPYYRILITPAVDLTVAALLVGFPDEQARTMQLDWVRRLLMAGLLAVYVGINLLLLRIDLSRQFDQALAELSTLIQPGDRLMASQTYWFGLYSQPYYSWENLVYYQRYQPGSSLADAFEEFKPEILIIDGQMENYILAEAGASLYSQHLRVPADELDAILAAHASLEASIPAVSYGQLRVYRFEWPLSLSTGG